MDRFQWLKCQAWLLPCPSASSSAAVDWLFQGFASFYTCALPQQEDDALSENAAHLFFSVRPSSLDPAQLAFKLGVSHQISPGQSNRGIVLCLDDETSFYSFDFKQVLLISMWKQEQGCKICRESSSVSADENTCSCQLLPLHVTVRLKHVNMIFYSRDQHSEACSSQIFRAMDVLCEALEEEKLSIGHDVSKLGSASCISEVPVDLSSVLGISERILREFLTRLDCMSECALGAVDVCNADVPWMTRFLHIMMQHAADHRERAVFSKSLQCKLMSCFKALEANDEQNAFIERKMLEDQGKR